MCLVVLELESDDAGGYLCVAENSAGSIQANFTLHTGKDNIDGQIIIIT